LKHLRVDYFLLTEEGDENDLKRVETISFQATAEKSAASFFMAWGRGEFLTHLLRLLQL
jgi:hypothetical protein